MNSNELQDLARDIRAGISAQESTRRADVDRPAILDEAAPTDARRAKWEADRDQSESDYAARLLTKGSLSASEQLWLSQQVARALRQR
jgi:hypothetical protein